MRLRRVNGLIECGTNPRESKLDTRIKIQKFVYFAQKRFGLRFRYRHTRYIYGPYSPELSTDYYRISDMDDIPGGGLDDWGEREKFLDFARFHNDAEWPEIGSTLLYIHSEAPLLMGRLIFRAKRVKRKYSRERIMEVCNELVGLGFIKL